MFIIVFLTLILTTKPHMKVYKILLTMIVIGNAFGAGRVSRSLFTYSQRYTFILIEVLGTIAEQERATIKQRQAEGIAAAKEQGKKLGRPALDFPANWDKVYTSWKAGEITAKRAMELTETKRTSFYKLVSMMEE